MRKEIVTIATALTAALMLAACAKKAEGPAPAPVPADESAAQPAPPVEQARPFAGIKADSLIYFGINENWEGQALMMGSIAYGLSGDLSTVSGAAPAGDVRVVVFGDLTAADALNAAKVGGKPNAAYRLTTDGKLEYLGDIDQSLDDEAVMKLCGDPDGATERISWADLDGFLTPAK